MSNSKKLLCILFLHIGCLRSSFCSAYLAPKSCCPQLQSSLAMQQASTLLGTEPSNLYGSRRRNFSLYVSTVDVEVPTNNSDLNSESKSNNMNASSDNKLLQWKDIVPISLFTTMCVIGAILISTYEDFDVTHTRPSPSTLRLPTTMMSSTENNRVNFIGAATKGMGWGPTNRGMQLENDNIQGGKEGTDEKFFEEWYGTSATTLQWKPSYNEIMLQHRSERVPRWNGLEFNDVGFNTAIISSAAKKSEATATLVVSKEQLQQAVQQLYQSLNELDELKLMADDYMWDEMRDRMMVNPATAQNNDMSSNNDEYSLPKALEYSMDILKSTPSIYDNANVKEIPDLIGFDWGSCAWRHCGAKADAQEAIAELYSTVGMLEPFECRFIIDIVERSIRDILAVVPDDLKPQQNGVVIQPKEYEPYVSQAGDDPDGMGIDYEYSQALSELRVDLTSLYLEDE